MTEQRRTTPDGSAGGPVSGSERRWRMVRRYLNASRAALTATAATLSNEWPAVEPGLIALPEWLPERPVPLGEVGLEWVPQPAPARVTGAESASFLVRPLRDDGYRYAGYAEALGEVDPPALLEDRPCYRLLSVAGGPPVRLSFGPASFFESLNVAEAVAHELAAVTMATAGRGGRSDLRRSDLPLRALLGEPGDFAGRTVVPALCTLTLRHEPGADTSFLLHWRDPARVASGGGLHQVAPVGAFQPADGVPGAEDVPGADPDFDLWRCMAREFSEELLGAAEHSGVDYGRWPFLKQLDDAREKGTCRPYYLGLGIDPLTFVADLLTVVVFDAAAFDEIFADLVTGNSEGPLTRVDFTEEQVTRYAGSEPTQPAGAALLELAWRHRTELLG